MNKAIDQNSYNSGINPSCDLQGKYIFCRQIYAVPFWPGTPGDLDPELVRVEQPSSWTQPCLVLWICMWPEHSPLPCGLLSLVTSSAGVIPSKDRAWTWRTLLNSWCSSCSASQVRRHSPEDVWSVLTTPAQNSSCSISNWVDLCLFCYI